MKKKFVPILAAGALIVVYASRKHHRKIYTFQRTYEFI